MAHPFAVVLYLCSSDRLSQERAPLPPSFQVIVGLLMSLIIIPITPSYIDTTSSKDRHVPCYTQVQIDIPRPEEPLDLTHMHYTLHIHVHSHPSTMYTEEPHVKYV